MTRIIPLNLACANCGAVNEVTTEVSITTWMYPELIEKILQDGYYFICSKCNYKTFMIMDILVNARKGMFNLNTGLPMVKKKQLLIDYGIINEDGNILNQTKLEDLSQAQHDPAIAGQISEIEKVVVKFKNNLLSGKEKKIEK